MKTWFLADPHFDHVSLISKRARPFSSINDWNQLLLANINHYVPRNNRLVIVGDFGFNVGKWRQLIKCKNIVYILGNHDKPQQIKQVFGSQVYQQRSMKLCQAKVFVSHYPNAFWPGSHHGNLHVYGHCHNQREAYLDSIWPDRRSMDVSPETAFELYGEWRPHEDTEIYERLISRVGHDQLSFYNDYQDQLEKNRCM